MIGVWYPTGFLIVGRLTHISLASLFWEARKTIDPDRTPQNAASDQGLHCLYTNISIKKLKNNTRHPLICNGLVQLTKIPLANIG